MEIGCHISEGLQAVAYSAMEDFRHQISQGALNVLDSLTFWIRPATPALANERTWANSDTVEFLHSSLLGITATVFAVAIIIAGLRIAWEQRAKPLQDLLKAILTFVVVGAMGTATMQLLTSWSDGFSVYIIDRVAKDMSLAAAFGGPVDDAGKAQDLVASSMPTIIAALTGLGVISASLIQIVLMLVRSALLVLLAGAFPLAAAATNTEIGRNWFKKFCGWSLAFIAYKPAAAMVYAAAMKMAQIHAGSTSDAVVRAMTGMMMMLLAIFALPALLRFMVPMTAAVAGGGSAMGSSVADPGGMATGAINIGSSGRGGGSRGGSLAGGSVGGGGGATGAQSVGAKAAGAIAGPAGVALAATRKVGGGVAGAASHSAGESGGGAITPSSASGPMAGRSGSRSSKSNRSNASPVAQQRVPEPAGPSGGW
ncbi:MAG TPA: hypothetical protein VGL05_32210 [Kribbella sp.]